MSRNQTQESTSNLSEINLNASQSPEVEYTTCNHFNISPATSNSKTEEILDYVDRLLPLVHTNWVKRYRTLWYNILQIPDVNSVVYEPGRQVGTCFNRAFVTNIIRTLSINGVYTTTNCSMQARHLEPQEKVHATGKKKANAFNSVKTTLTHPLKSESTTDSIVRLLKKRNLNPIPTSTTDNSQLSNQASPNLLQQYGDNSTVSNNLFYLGQPLYAPKASYITQVITKLSEIINPLNYEYDVLDVDISKKIDYNNLQEWREKIFLYSPCFNKVERIYESFDAYGFLMCDKILNTLNNIYMRFNTGPQGDILFSLIYNETHNIMFNNPDISGYQEDLEDALCAVLVHAFMKCRIMKKPPRQ